MNVADWCTIISMAVAGQSYGSWPTWVFRSAVAALLLLSVTLIHAADRLNQESATYVGIGPPRWTPEAQQAADLLGIGRDNLIAVETDDNNRIDMKRLREHCTRLRGEGIRPLSLIGIAGTTVSRFCASGSSRSACSARRR